MRKLKYQVYNDRTDKLIADIFYDSETNTYDADLKYYSWDIPILFGRPPFEPTPNPESEYIENFLASRVLPPNRQLIKEMLAETGLYEYDWKEMIKLNKGRSVEDWFRVETIEG